MKIVIIGTGYVGLVTGTCLSQIGHEVICVDSKVVKINDLNNFVIPIYEPGLETIIKQNVADGRLFFTTNLAKALKKVDIAFIAVGTPMGEDGLADLQYVLAVADEIGECMQKPLIVVNKSTVPIGSAKKVTNHIEAQLIKRNLEVDFDVVSNPEFLKEGCAIKDFMAPDRIVVGANKASSFKIMQALYAPITAKGHPLITMGIESAEMTKYAANAMLATKISFINEMSQICEQVGADINDVREGIGSDTRIGPKFINPGCGYGGSCFPKDVRALTHIAKSHNYDSKLIQAVDEVNQKQKMVLSKKVMAVFGEHLTDKTFAVWGLSFKPDTDDMREAASISVIQALTEAGANIKAYDPKAMNEARQHYLKDNTQVEYFEEAYDALNQCEALIIVTEWDCFKQPDFAEIKSRLNNPIIFDGRNIYSQKNLPQLGFEYHQIGVQSS